MYLAHSCAHAEATYTIARIADWTGDKFTRLSQLFRAVIEDLGAWS